MTAAAAPRTRQSAALRVADARGSNGGAGALAAAAARTFGDSPTVGYEGDALAAIAAGQRARAAAAPRRAAARAGSPRREGGS